MNRIHTHLEPILKTEKRKGTGWGRRKRRKAGGRQKEGRMKERRNEPSKMLNLHVVGILGQKKMWRHLK